MGFVQGAVCIFATKGGMASTASCSRLRYAVGDSPTISVNRELKEPRSAADAGGFVGDARADPQQGHRTFDSAGHQVAVGRLSVGRTKLPREVRG